MAEILAIAMVAAVCVLLLVGIAAEATGSAVLAIRWLKNPATPATAPTRLGRRAAAVPAT